MLFPSTRSTPGHSHPKLYWDRRQERSAPDITAEVLLKPLEDKLPDKCYWSLFPSRFQTQQEGTRWG